MITHIPFPSAYHIGKDGNIRESEINEERHIILKLVMICARGFLAKFFLGAFVVLTVQPKLSHVFNTLLEGSCLLAYSSLTDAARLKCANRAVTLLFIALQRGSQFSFR